MMNLNDDLLKKIKKRLHYHLHFPRIPHELNQLIEVVYETMSVAVEDASPKIKYRQFFFSLKKTKTQTIRRLIHWLISISKSHSNHHHHHHHHLHRSPH